MNPCVWAPFSRALWMCWAVMSLSERERERGGEPGESQAVNPFHETLQQTELTFKTYTIK